MDFRDLEKEEELRTIYNEYKTLFIRAEEQLEEMRFFVAPMLEHRDALDHMMRYLQKTVQRDEVAKEKALDELKMAIDHEYRAFFDIADYICITVRSRIYDSIKHTPNWRIRSKWTTYSEDRRRITEISEKIVNIRNARETRSDSVKAYVKMMDEVFSLHKDFVEEIEPALKGFGKSNKCKKTK